METQTAVVTAVPMEAEMEMQTAAGMAGPMEVVSQAALTAALALMLHTKPGSGASQWHTHRARSRSHSSSDLPGRPPGDDQGDPGLCLPLPCMLFAQRLLAQTRKDSSQRLQHTRICT